MPSPLQVPCPHHDIEARVRATAIHVNARADLREEHSAKHRMPWPGVAQPPLPQGARLLSLRVGPHRPGRNWRLAPLGPATLSVMHFFHGGEAPSRRNGATCLRRPPLKKKTWSTGGDNQTIVLERF